MPIWTLAAILTLLFAIPGALAVVLAWPLIVHGPVPTRLDTDAYAIAAVSLLLGFLVTILIFPKVRRGSRLRRR